MDLQFLPYIVVTNPHIKKVYDSYQHAFETLHNLPRVKTVEQNAEFTVLLKRLVDEHGQSVRSTSIGLLLHPRLCTYLCTKSLSFNPYDQGMTCKSINQPACDSLKPDCKERTALTAECDCSLNPLDAAAAPMLDALAAGLRECNSKPFVGAKLELNSFLENMLTSRISRRVLAEQHINLHNRRCRLCQVPARPFPAILSHRALHCMLL